MLILYKNLWHYQRKKEYIKKNITYLLVAVYLKRKSATFSFAKTINTARKERGIRND